MFRLIRTPRIFRLIFPRRTWGFSLNEKKIYLTFDDGPNPILTPFVLDLLQQYEFKATFFCVGENVLKYPELTNRILQEGHQIGNHTQHHLNALKVSKNAYFDSVEQFNETFSTILFRPPYGRLPWNYTSKITQKHKIIMWTWLTYDFDDSYPIHSILKDANGLRNGDIVVLHDNDRFEGRVKELLPQLFQIIHHKGFECVVVPN